MNSEVDLVKIERIQRPDLQSEVLARLAKIIAAAEPGSRLPSERALCQLLGVGRSTLREAVRSLAFMGAIQVRQGDGIYVSENNGSRLERLIGLGVMFQRSTVQEVVEVRRLLEVEAAALATIHHKHEDKENLLSIMEKMRAHAHNPSEASSFDLEFHVALARASHNSVLVYFINGMRALFEVWMDKAIDRRETVASILEEHQAVLDALVAKDAERAKHAMNYHLSNAAGRLFSAIGGDLSTADFIAALLVPKSP